MKAPRRLAAKPCAASMTGCRRSGFSLIELMGSTLLLSIVLLGAVMGFSFTLRNDRLISTRTELEMDARMLVERLRQDLWLTSRAEILLYPPGDGPYEAIGFPVIRSGNPQLDGAQQIIWESTVIYHRWEGEPNQVRRTVFEPRDNLTTSQRLEQMAEVVRDGHGENTYNSANARTRALINNLVDWELNIRGARFDAYAPDAERKLIGFGSAVIDPGPQELTFRVVGKNAAHGGVPRHLGVDVLYVSPSGLPVEAEWMNVVAHAGATPAVQNIGTEEQWSGNARRYFDANHDGASFTLQIHNDRWEERNFVPTGMVKHQLERVLVAEPGQPQTFALRLEGDGPIWRAAEQTLDDSSGTLVQLPTNTAFRVFLRGDNLSEEEDGGWINHDGTNIWATFQVAEGASAEVRDAFIAPWTGELDPVHQTPIRFEDGQNTATFTERITSDPVPFVMQMTNSYIVGYTLAGTDAAIVRRWDAQESQVTSTYARPADSSAVWSEFASVYSLHSVYSGHAADGVYVSPIIDTTQDGPVYEQLKWTTVVPPLENDTWESLPAVHLRIRAGHEPDLSDADDWEDIPVAVSGLAPSIAGRYAQVQATLTPGVLSSQQTRSPELRDFTLSWVGERRFVDLAGIISRAPNHGIYEVLLNGAPLVQGITVDVTVYKDVRLGLGQPRRVEGSTYTEIVPRNTR